MGWRCYMATATQFARRALRRYGAGGMTCKLPHGYHDAEVVIDNQFEARDEELGGRLRDQFKGDARWPKACACGYVFHPEDEWQVNVDRLYAGALDGQLYRLRDLPPGGIWRADWMEDIRDNRYAAPDGKVWFVMLPGRGEFPIYAKTGDGTRWDIRGELPALTLSPSINMHGTYHGYIQNGVITEDCEGRQFPGLARTA